jgi:splicing factor 3B subunit 3
MAVGLDDNTIRVISLDPEDCLQTLSMQALPSQASSLAIVRMDGSGVLEGALYLFLTHRSVFYSSLSHILCLNY